MTNKNKIIGMSFLIVAMVAFIFALQGVSAIAPIECNVTSTFYADSDSDGFGNLGNSNESCEAPVGYVNNSLDCNDFNATINPDASEVCNLLDDNCNLQVDENVTITIYRDADNDTFGTHIDSIVSCSLAQGYVNNSLDCNDQNSSINPNALETCNTIDDDCDGLTDEGLNATWYNDVDHDGIGNANNSIMACSSVAGYANVSGDNCPTVFNVNQSNVDNDSLGDACDACPHIAGSYCNGCPKPTCTTCLNATCVGTGAPFCANASVTTQCGPARFEFDCPWGMGLGNDTGVRLNYTHCDGGGQCVNTVSNWSVDEACNSEKSCFWNGAGHSDSNYYCTGNCSPHWVLNATWSVCMNGSQQQNYVDANKCQTNQTAPTALNWSCSFVVYSPMDGIFNRKQVLLNMSSGAQADQIAYVISSNDNPGQRNLCRNCNSFGYMSKRTQTFPEGANNVTFRAIYPGDVLEQEREIFIDSKPPKILHVEPAKGKYATGEFTIKYTEENCQMINYSIQGTNHSIVGNESCESGRNKVKILDLNLSTFEGDTLNFTVLITDIAGNNDSQENNNLMVDTIPVAFNSVNFHVVGHKVYLEVNLTEEARSLTYTTLDEGRERMLCATCDEYGISSRKWKTFDPGFHNVTLTTYDRARNTAMSYISFNIV